LSACLLLAASVSLAEDRNKGKEDAIQSITDEQFVMMASQAGLAEVNHGVLAAKQANSHEVREFAQRMVRDHNKANAELLALADKRRLTVARDMGDKHKAVQQRLTGLSGEDFDRHYMQHMVKDHEKAVALFTAEAKNGKDEGLKQFAEKTLPTIQEHLKMARDISGRLKGGATDKPTGSGK
jgi:putative membrane protein